MHALSETDWAVLAEGWYIRSIGSLKINKNSENTMELNVYYSSLVRYSHTPLLDYRLSIIHSTGQANCRTHNIGIIMRLWVQLVHKSFHIHKCYSKALAIKIHGGQCACVQCAGVALNGKYFAVGPEADLLIKQPIENHQELGSFNTHLNHFSRGDSTWSLNNSIFFFFFSTLPGGLPEANPRVNMAQSMFIFVNELVI